MVFSLRTMIITVTYIIILFAIANNRGPHFQFCQNSHIHIFGIMYRRTHELGWKNATRKFSQVTSWTQYTAFYIMTNKLIISWLLVEDYSHSDTKFYNRERTVIFKNNKRKLQQKMPSENKKPKSFINKKYNVIIRSQSSRTTQTLLLPLVSPLNQFSNGLMNNLSLWYWAKPSLLCVSKYLRFW